MHSVTPFKSTPQGCRHELKVWGLNFERVPGESPLEIHSSNCSDFSMSHVILATFAQLFTTERCALAGFHYNAFHSSGLLFNEVTMFFSHCMHFTDCCMGKFISNL